MVCLWLGLFRSWFHHRRGVSSKSASLFGAGHGGDLAADAELLNQRVVTLVALALEIAQQALTTAQHLHQPLAR